MQTDTINVVVTGSECTGKTTLAQRLGAHFDVAVVPEFVRSFADTVGGRLHFSDHGPIARGQMGLADEYGARASGLLVHDTDLISTLIYCRHYFDRCPEWIEAAAMDRKAALYLLCEIDVPWVPDRMRDRGARREEMHGLFVEQLISAGAPWHLMRGSEQVRFDSACQLISSLRS
jgi:nicotinamide riboside kinase